MTYETSSNEGIRNDKVDMLPPSEFLANMSWQRLHKKKLQSNRNKIALASLNLLHVSDEERKLVVTSSKLLETFMTRKIAALIRTGYVERKENYSFDSQRVIDIELFRAAYDCLTYYLARP